MPNLQNHTTSYELSKDIKGYNGRYKISQSGVVLSTRYKRVDGRTFPEKVLQQAISRTGYPTVVLYTKQGKHNRIAVHRLVAQTFIKNPKRLPHVNHKDGNRTNNNVENLEWCTPSQNHLHSYRVLGRVPSNKGNKKIRPILKCGWCMKDFTQKRVHQTFCSQKCAKIRNGNQIKRNFN